MTNAFLRCCSIVPAWILALVASCGLSFAGRQAALASPSQLAAVWINSGEDKVTQNELRVSRDHRDVRNTCWDGERVLLFGGRNESISFNVVLEATNSPARSVSVTMSPLITASGGAITSSSRAPRELANFVGRNIELFYVRYLELRGVSTLSYEHYDERHVPQRFRRPHDKVGKARGLWQDRPDHNQFYPEIAVPLELHTPFDVAGGTNQSIWVDVYIPPDAAAGTYHGNVSILENGVETKQIPVHLVVRSFALPDLPSARTMLYLSVENVNRRYLGSSYPDPGTPMYEQSLKIIDRHFQLAHRHRISLIDAYTPIEQLSAAWTARLNGSLFTPAYGYEGVGIGVGNNVYSIGSYGTWPWSDGSQRQMWSQSDAWVNWFDRQGFETPTDYFLYLIDESQDFPLIEKWSRWVDANPGPGHRLFTMATLPAPIAVRDTPSLDVVTSTMMAGSKDEWERAIREIQTRGRAHLIMYNGWRPASGCFVTEDDGVALRELAWGQFKMRVPRWFAWESTYYNNYQGGLGETNVFRTAQVFGAHSRSDPVLGETGDNYNNGDGVLFYPGTDRVFAEDSYGLPFPFASLRLKFWRRGLQDVDYLVMATRIDKPAVSRLVEQMVPKILWELDVDDQNDPTWVMSDISWPTDPDRWEDARRQLADIIEKGKASQVD